MEEHIFDVAGRIEVFFVLGDAFYKLFRKNEASIGGLPGDSFVFVVFEEGGGVVEIATLALGALGFDLAESFEALLELPGKATALDG